MGPDSPDPPDSPDSLRLPQHQEPGQRYYTYEVTRHDGHKGRDRSMSITSVISRSDWGHSNRKEEGLVDHHNGILSEV